MTRPLDPAEFASRSRALDLDTAPDCSPLDLPPDFDLGEALGTQLTPSRRADGWTAERQRKFCELVATGNTVEGAARYLGLTPSSAYSFRNSARGAAFAIGWAAAAMLQRQCLADRLAARAFEGQTVTITRPDGETIERHYYDNRLAMSVLTRLDRLAAGHAASARPAAAAGGATPHPVAAALAEEHAARLASGEWDRYLDLLAGDATPARAGLFLAQRTADRATPGSPELAALSTLARADLYDRTRAGVPAEVATDDLDVAHRAEWTAGQWARAEAAGLLTVAPPPPAPTPAPAPAPKPVAAQADGSSQESQHSAAVREDPAIWWCDETDTWRTRFPPPDDFLGEEEGAYGQEDYERTLSDEEAEIMDAACRPAPALVAAAAADRDAYLAEIAADNVARGTAVPATAAPAH